MAQNTQPATKRDRSPKAETNRRATTPTATENTCRCGCGSAVNGRYLPGHDARHVSKLYADIEQNGRSAAAIKAAMRQLGSEPLKAKLQRMLDRPAKPARNTWRCASCGLDVRPADRSRENPEVCVTCWEQAGWENDHSDGGHEPGTRGDVCPVCNPSIIPGLVYAEEVQA